MLLLIAGVLILPIIGIGEIIIENKKRKENMIKYSLLDSIGIVFNLFLSILYVPFSLFTIVGGIFTDYIPEGMEFIVIANAFVYMHMPIICLISLILSVRLRCSRKSIISFIIQFVPIIFFILSLVLVSIVGEIVN